MTTFDKLKGAAATLADAAVKTTGDLAQKGKKQMDLLALENKLSRAQRQLGALVYALHKNGEENGRNLFIREGELDEDGTAVFCCPDVDTINVFRIEIVE